MATTNPSSTEGAEVAGKYARKVEHRGRTANRRWQVIRRRPDQVRVERAVKAPVIAKPTPAEQAETVPVILPTLLWCGLLVLCATIGPYSISAFCVITAYMAAAQRAVHIGDTSESKHITSTQNLVFILYSVCAASLVFITFYASISWTLAVIGFGIAYDIGARVFSRPDSNPWDVPLATATTLMVAALIVSDIVDVASSSLPWLCALIVGTFAPLARLMFQKMKVKVPHARFTSCRFDSIILAAPLCAIVIAMLH